MKNNDQNIKESDQMPRKTEIPKISSYTVNYNGNRSQFDRFIEVLMIGFLNQDSIPNYEEDSSVQKVEVSEKTD